MTSNKRTSFMNAKLADNNLIISRDISSTDSFIVGALGVGEGWHNYHVRLPRGEFLLQNILMSINFSTFFHGTTRRLSCPATGVIFRSHSLTFSLGSVDFF